MTHLELENLASDYLEGQLEQARKHEVEGHLESCAACRELMADLRHALELCKSAEEVEPAPWLVSKILLATIGERKPTLRERLNAFFQPVLRPRVAYSVAMACFLDLHHHQRGGDQLARSDSRGPEPTQLGLPGKSDRALACRAGREVLLRPPGGL